MLFPASFVKVNLNKVSKKAAAEIGNAAIELAKIDGITNSQYSMAVQVCINQAAMCNRGIARFEYKDNYLSIISCAKDSKDEYATTISPSGSLCL